MLGALNETNGDNLHKVLTVIIVDACKWIVSTTDSSSGEESCDSPDLLRKQCVGERSKASGWLNSTFIHYKTSTRLWDTHGKHTIVFYNYTLFVIVQISQIPYISNFFFFTCIYYPCIIIMLS